MLKGDLTSTPLAPLLLELANDAATGCLHISDTSRRGSARLPQGRLDLFGLGAGQPCPARREAGLLRCARTGCPRRGVGGSAHRAAGLAARRAARPPRVRRRAVVEAFVKEQVNEALWDLLRWPEGDWKFRKNVTAREDVGPPMGVVELLETLRERGYSGRPSPRSSTALPPCLRSSAARRRPTPRRRSTTTPGRCCARSTASARSRTSPPTAATPCSKPATSSCRWCTPGWSTSRRTSTSISTTRRCRR